MPYTLTVGFIWFGLSAVIGLVVGWVLRSASASRQVSRARKQVQHDLEQEMAELRERATTLGRVAEERDALQAEVESMKARLVASVAEVDNTDDATTMRLVQMMVRMSHDLTVSMMSRTCSRNKNCRLKRASIRALMLLLDRQCSDVVWCRTT
ncbi:MAG: hypothetical protein EBS76_00800 [Actinobacteria bacterium]|nr:hypothetical protein [Actinomycetota bacterium]